mmetsp:Transcript_4426/g.12801  ORF Transcript_4426/g.12801 Transcript_4426/m.12801 type:complete len:535 (+) Transcript_4426:1304-2908(+)|eukprot:352088-Chlamydomonas_euryale.AAC.22
MDAAVLAHAVAARRRASSASTRGRSASSEADDVLPTAFLVVASLAAWRGAGYAPRVAHIAAVAAAVAVRVLGTCARGSPAGCRPPALLAPAVGAADEWPTRRIRDQSCCDSKDDDGGRVDGGAEASPCATVLSVALGSVAASLAGAACGLDGASPVSRWCSAAGTAAAVASATEAAGGDVEAGSSVTCNRGRMRASTSAASRCSCPMAVASNGCSPCEPPPPSPVRCSAASCASSACCSASSSDSSSGCGRADTPRTLLLPTSASCRAVVPCSGELAVVRCACRRRACSESMSSITADSCIALGAAPPPATPPLSPPCPLTPPMPVGGGAAALVAAVERGQEPAATSSQAAVSGGRSGPCIVAVPSAAVVNGSTGAVARRNLPVGAEKVFGQLSLVTRRGGSQSAPTPRLSPSLPALVPNPGPPTPRLGPRLTASSSIAGPPAPRLTPSTSCSSRCTKSSRLAIVRAADAVRKSGVAALLVLGLAALEPCRAADAIGCVDGCHPATDACDGMIERRAASALMGWSHCASGAPRA